MGSLRQEWQGKGEKIGHRLLAETSSQRSDYMGQSHSFLSEFSTQSRYAVSRRYRVHAKPICLKYHRSPNLTFPPPRTLAFDYLRMRHRYYASSKECQDSLPSSRVNRIAPHQLVCYQLISSQRACLKQLQKAIPRCHGNQMQLASHGGVHHSHACNATSVAT